MPAELTKIEFPFVNHEKEIIIDESLEKFLRLIGKKNLYEQLSYILKEIVGNANKANFKRLYFIKKNLDINSPADYEKGIKSFREDLSINIDEYSSEIINTGYHVKVTFGADDKNFIITVVNTNSLLPVEKNRIQDRIKMAIKFNNIEEVFNEALDATEGAGFGLILTVLMLRKIGIDEKVLNYNSTEGSTEAKLAIPLSILNKEQEEIIADVIKKEIEEIPQFPDHIIELQKILSNPNSDFKDLAVIINKDPSLVADLIKIANSSLYMLPTKVKSIEEAVRLVGFSGVKNLVLTYSVNKLLNDKYKVDLIKENMSHSSEVAFYAYELAKKFNFKDLLDQVYTSAILHDFGKIIINSLHPDVLDKISKLSNSRGINSSIIENLTDGFNHSLIGAKLAEKWNFSDSLIQSIKFHHLPLEAKDEYKKLVYIVYLANIVYYYKRNSFDFNNINFHVLKFLNINIKEDFDKILKPIVYKER